MPSTIVGLSDAWRDHNKHWHAYIESDDVKLAAIDRWQRLQRDADAALLTPAAVADWIEQRIVEIGDRRQLRALVDDKWVNLGGADHLVDLYGEHVAIASRGESIYTGIQNGHRRIELFVDAVTRDVCGLH